MTHIFQCVVPSCIFFKISINSKSCATNSSPPRKTKKISSTVVMSYQFKALLLISSSLDRLSMKLIIYLYICISLFGWGYWYFSFVFPSWIIFSLFSSLDLVTTCKFWNSRLYVLIWSIVGLNFLVHHSFQGNREMFQRVAFNPTFSTYFKLVLSLRGKSWLIWSSL